MRKIRAAADALRPNPEVNAREEITVLGIGEALVSVMEADNVPGMVQKVRIIPPAGQIGPVSDLERKTLIESPLWELLKVGFWGVMAYIRIKVMLAAW